jgi:hypothetical protein
MFFAIRAWKVVGRSRLFMAVIVSLWYVAEIAMSHWILAHAGLQLDFVRRDHLASGCFTISAARGRGESFRRPVWSSFVLMIQFMPGPSILWRSCELASNILIGAPIIWGLFKNKSDLLQTKKWVIKIDRVFVEAQLLPTFVYVTLW